MKKLDLKPSVKVQCINNHNERKGSDVRYWITDNRYFVCYNATTDCDDISEVTKEQIDEAYKQLIKEERN